MLQKKVIDMNGTINLNSSSTKSDFNQNEDIIQEIHKYKKHQNNLIENCNRVLDIANFNYEAAEISEDFYNSGFETDWPKIKQFFIDENNYLYDLNPKKVIPIDCSSGTAGSVLAFIGKDIDNHEYRTNGSIKIKSSIDRYDTFISTLDYPEKLFLIFKNFGFDNSYRGKESALDQFTVSWNLQKANAGNDTKVAIASCLAIRNCMKITRDTFIMNRGKNQSKIKNKEKIKVICDEFGKQSLSEERIEFFSKEYEEIWSILSTKTDSISILEWKKRLIRTSLFIESILLGMNPISLHK